MSGRAREAAELFARCCPPEVVRRARREGWCAPLWQQLEATGLARVGTELPLADAAAVVRVAATFAAPVPLAETVLAAWLRGADVPPGPLTVAHRGRASYGRVAAAVLSGDRFVRPEDAGLTPAVNLAGEPLDRVAAADAAGADVRRLGALVRAVQMAGALERVLELCAAAGEEHRELTLLAGDVASAATGVEHAVEFPGEVEVAAAKIRAGEAATRAAATVHRLVGAEGAGGEHELGLYTGRLRSWRDDFGSESEWAALLGGRVAADPGLVWGHAPARGTD